MYSKLGVQNAGILTAALGTGLSIIPFLLFAYGARLRARSPFAQELARLEEQEREAAAEHRRLMARGDAEDARVVREKESEREAEEGVEVPDEADERCAGIEGERITGAKVA